MTEADITPSADDVGRLPRWEAIMAEHETALLRYTGRLLHNASAAEDVVQAVFIKLFRHWQDGMQPTAHLKRWLYQVAHNEAVDHIRRESRLRVLHARHAEERFAEGAGGAPDAEGAEEARRAAVLALVRTLKPGEQQVVLLRLQEGLSYREISAITGRSEGNVGNILHHAVQTLARRLKRAGLSTQTEGGGS